MSDNDNRDAIEEACFRVNAHEQLIRDVTRTVCTSDTATFLLAIKEANLSREQHPTGPRPVLEHAAKMGVDVNTLLSHR